MGTSVLTTKLYVPSPRSDIVRRPRLLRRLDDAFHLGHQLTLICAPAGSGKTTLVSTWISHFGLYSALEEPIQNRVSWLSLDEADDDVTRFWTYVIAALQIHDPDIGRASLGVLQSPQPLPPHAILTPLLNELAARVAARAGGDRILLVLDDYHAISKQAIHDGLAFLIDHQPPGLHLILTTRTDPPLPIGRLRARGQLTEVRGADLRFTVDEAAAFLNTAMGLDLGSDEVQALESRTEGWIAGLQLAALSLRGRDDRGAFVRDFGGSHRYVIEYLSAEVVRRQPEGVQHFLLQTSILDRLCAPLCDALLQGSHSSELLAYLEAANLFLIPLDEGRRWYRYHRLFADLLQERLRQEMAPEQITVLYRRASAWHETHGATEEAIRYALAAGDHDRAGRLIEASVTTSLVSGPNQLMAWVEALPDEVVRGRPALSVVRAWTATFAGRLDAVEAWLEAAEVPAPPATGDPEMRYLIGGVAAMRAFIAERKGDLARAIELAQEADDLLPPSDRAVRVFVPYVLGRARRAAGDLRGAERACVDLERYGRLSNNVLSIALARCELAGLRKVQGRLREAERLYRELLGDEQAHGGRGFGAEAIVDAGRCELSYEWNELTAAEEAARTVLDSLAEDPWWGAPADFEVAYATLARALDARGESDAALDVLDRAERERKQYNLFPTFRSRIDLCRVRLWLGRGNVVAACAWAEQGSVGQTGPLLRREAEQIGAARVLLASGRAAAAADQLRAVADQAEAGERRRELVEVLALQALALQTLRDEAGARDTLARCLRLAAPEAYVRTFIDEGEVMHSLLSEFRAWIDRHPTRATEDAGLIDYVDSLLAAFSAASARAAKGGQAGIPSLVEPLTPRESEVLAWIARGLSNREIADELVLSENTIKRHASSLYGKLDVGSRTQAVARARELGLL